MKMSNSYPITPRELAGLRRRRHHNLKSLRDGYSRSPCSTFSVNSSAVAQPFERDRSPQRSSTELTARTFWNFPREFSSFQTGNLRRRESEPIPDTVLPAYSRDPLVPG